MIKFFRKTLQTEKPEGTFVEDRLRTRGSQKRTVIAMLGGVAVIGWLYVFLFSDVFTVQQIEIQGTKTLERGEVVEAAEKGIEKMRVWPFRLGNLFFISDAELSRVLKDKLFAQSVTVDKKYPNILRLNIQERQSSLVILKESRMWQIDRNGVIMREISDPAEKSSIEDQMAHPVADRSSALPILEVSHDIDPSVGNTYVSDYRVSLWLDAFKSLQDLGFGYRNASVEYATSTKLILNMFEPYQVYVDLMEPIQQQIQGVYDFLKIKKDTVIHEYIDARIPGKIYYK